MTPAGAPTLFVISPDATLRRETMRGARYGSLENGVDRSHYRQV